MNQKINTLSVTNPPSAGIADTVVLTSSAHALDAAVNFLPTDVNLSGSVDTPINIPTAPTTSPTLEITTTWQADPSDLDVHITFPSSGSGRVHVTWSNLSEENTTLNNDVLSGFGPEIISSTSLNDGIYRYSVKHYSGSGSMFGSAVAELKVNNVVIDTQTAPAAATDIEDLWRVWDIKVVAGQAVAYGRINDVIKLAPETGDVYDPPSTTGININAHGLIDGQAVYFYSSGNLPSPLQAFTTYYVKYIDANTFQLSATYQGSAITLADEGTGVHSLLKAFNVRLRDPWDNVLKAINLTGLSLDQIAALNASDTPNSSNPLITNSYLSNQLLGKKGFVTVGPSGSNADFESDDDTAFAEAINFILTRNPNGGWIIVTPGTYNFTKTITVPSGICIEGVHPQTATIVAGGNFSAFELTGSSRLDKLQIQAPSATTKAAVKISGEKCIIEKCLITNFTYAGLQVAGYRNKVLSCRIEDTSSAASQGIILQSFQNNINWCSFVGPFNSGALKVEGNDCGCFNSYFDSTLVGYSYLILSDSVANTRLVGNHFASNDSLIISYDYGTTSVRYGNTPNTPNVNQNNFSLPLANYTGQPTLSTSSVTLSNNFTTNGANNLTDILSNLDLFLQRSFEERNFFLSSTDPTYDSTGVPTAGVGSWDGSTLSIPTFYIHSTLARAGRWVINSASYALAAGQVLYVEINQTLDAADIVLTPMVAAYPLPLTASTDAWRLVLAVGLGGNQAIWLEGFRLLTGMTSFDVEGTLLPLARFIGVTDIKNPSDPFNGFAAGTAADLTTKLGAQSKLLENLYERTNLSLEPVTSDAEFSTDPVAGNYLDTTVGLPSRPTHIVQAFKLTYALVPTSGLYVFDSGSSSWSKIPGHPLAPDYTALSFVGVSIGILTTTGAIAAYNPYLNTWATYSPLLDEYISSILLPFASSRSLSFPLGGQADYALQTDNFTYFTTLDGYTVRYSLKNNSLNYVPRAYTQDVGDHGLLGPSLKDSSYNTLRDTKDLFETLDNGVSYTTSLPCSKGKLINFAGTYWYSEVIDFSSLELINFAYDEFSGAWLAVYTNNSYNFILGGGKDTSYLYSVQGDFDDFQTHYWALNPIKQEVIALGAKTSTGAFTAQISSYNVDALTWTWTTQILGLAGTSQGCIAIYDTYSAGDLWVLVSNPARSNRPTVWKRNGTTGNWTSTTLTNSVSDVSDTLVSAAVANSFLYVAYLANKLKGYAAVSPTAINFYVADSARSNRPTVFNYNRVLGTYTGVRLAEAGGDVVLTHATANSADIFLGAFYHAPSKTNFFAVQRADNYTVFFAQHEVVANFAGWTNIRSNLNQFTIPTTKALITNKITGDNTDSLNSPYVFYFLCSQGFMTITLTGSNSGYTSVVFSKLAYTSKLLGFSSTGTSIYIPQVGSMRGGEPSISIGSWAKTDTANIQAAGLGLDPGLGDGIFWSETGSYVKHIKRTINGIKEGSLWSGVNRGGYLWIADSARRTRQTEMTPNHVTLRGNYDVANLGAIAGDYDYAINGDGTQVAFVYANSSLGNVLSFLLWDIETETVVAYERGGFAPLNPAGISACGSTPQILYNTVTSTWDIVVQDDSREGGQVAFYRRTVAGVWSLETLGAMSGSKTLPEMIANAGLNPCKPVLVNNGDIVLCTSDSSSNLLVFYRVHSSNQWASSSQITGGGFNKPVLAADSLNEYWVFGGYDGANARIAKSNSYMSGFSVYSSDVSDVYNRVFTPRYHVNYDAIIVGSPLAQNGTAVDNQEMGVFRFPNVTEVDSANIFAAKGRLIGASGEEETNYGDHSFTSDGKLLYSAERFGRTDRHYSIRISRNGFKTLGDSALGSGRLLTLGNRCYREEYASASRPLIVEYDYNYNIISYRDNLPIAEREPETFLTLRYPYVADSSPSNLFSDASLPSGSLNAIEAREFPLICGNTRIQGGPGAGLLYFGAMASISASYLPATNLLRLEALNALTIKGTWKITAPNSGTAYTITGPIVYMLDASATGSHLVLQFPNAGTLTLDSVANPLTYWSNLDYTQNSYALVLGEVRERYFTLYSKTKLTYGNIENTVLANPVKYYTRNKEFLKEFFITPLTIDSLAVQEVGALDGIQKQNFSVLGHLLLVQGLPPNGTGYHYFVVFNIATADIMLSGMKFQHVAGKFENIVVFNS